MPPLPPGILADLPWNQPLRPNGRSICFGYATLLSKRVKCMKPLRDLILVATILLSRPAFSIDQCYGFLIPPTSNLYEKASFGKVLHPPREKWSVGIPDAGVRTDKTDEFSIFETGKIRITSSGDVRKAGACMPSIFTLENEFIRLWFQPQLRNEELVWAVRSELVEFRYNLPRTFSHQTLAENVPLIRDAADKALDLINAWRRTESTSVESVFVVPGSVETTWGALQDTLRSEDWTIRDSDRVQGVVAAESGDIKLLTHFACPTADVHTPHVLLFSALRASGSESHLKLLAFTDVSSATILTRCRSLGTLERALADKVRIRATNTH